jgi:hypothetical protein
MRRRTRPGFRFADLHASARGSAGHERASRLVEQQDDLPRPGASDCSSRASARGALESSSVGSSGIHERRLRCSRADPASVVGAHAGQCGLDRPHIAALYQLWIVERPDGIPSDRTYPGRHTMRVGNARVPVRRRRSVSKR